MKHASQEKTKDSRFTIHDSRRGFVLPFAVLLSGILLSIGLAIFSITLKELILSSSGRESQFAFFAADAGTECALYWDLRHPDISTSVFDTYTVGTTTQGVSDMMGFDAASSGRAQNSQSVTYTHPTGSNQNRLLVVGVEIEDDSSSDCVVSNVTYGGTSLMQAANAQAFSAGTYMCVSLWYLTDPTSGSADVVVTTQGITTSITSGVVSLYNAAQQAPEATAVNTNTGQTSISTNIAVVTDGSWIIDAIGSGQNGGNFSATDNGHTERYDLDGLGTHRGAGGTKEVASAGQSALAWSHASANRLAHVLASFAPYSEAGFSQEASEHGAISQNTDGILCNSQNITVPATGWDPYTGWDSVVSDTGVVTTVFDMKFANDTCASVTVVKDNVETRVDSRGYNTCDLGGTRRVERGLRVKY